MATFKPLPRDTPRPLWNAGPRPGHRLPFYNISVGIFDLLIARSLFSLPMTTMSVHFRNSKFPISQLRAKVQA